MNRVAVGQGKGALEDVLQFAHVAGERIGLECGEGVGAEFGRGALHRVGEALQDGSRQQWQVAAAFAELFTRLQETGVAPVAPPFVVASMPQNGTMRIEVGVPCSAPPGNDTLHAGNLPGGRVAVTVHHGAYDAIGPVYEALSRWIFEHGHSMAGPPREVFLTGPADVSSPAEHVTELVWPIN